MLTDVTVERKSLKGRLLAGAIALGYLALAASLAAGAQSGSTTAKGPAAAATATVAAATPTGTAAGSARGTATGTAKGVAATATPAPDPFRVELAESAPVKVDSPAGATAATTKRDADGKIELHVKNEELSNVLEMLSREYELNIVATRGARGRISADLYRVTLDQVLDAICRGSGLKWGREGSTLYVMSAEEMAATKVEDSRLATDVFVLNHLSSDEASKMVVPVLSAKATVAFSSAPGKGLPSGADDVGSNSYSLPDALVIRDYPENLEAVRKLLKKMDSKPRQVLVEATILQVTLNDKTSLGVNFNTLAGIDFNQLSNTNIPISNPLSVPNDITSTTPISNAPFAHVSTQGFATPGAGLNIGVVTNNVAFFINALEAVTDTHILGNPKVLALNRQRAEVIVGERFGYLTTEVSNSTTIQTVNFLETGTQLIFRPFITDDNHIRLEIHPKVSTGAVVQGLPDEKTTEVTCNIMVKDGNTVVIGGLFDETASIGRKQIPGLGNVPFLGWLMRSKEDSSVRREIVILLTPHIIDDEQGYTELSEQQLADAKRGCLGMREGFSCFTRERITVAYMQEADKAWKSYERTHDPKDLDKACWKVQMASNISPNDVKVLRLKDKVLTVRNGTPYSPPNWTIWDSLGDRLDVYEKTKAEKVKTGQIPPPPGISSAEYRLDEPKQASKAEDIAKAMANPTDAPGAVDKGAVKQPAGPADQPGLPAAAAPVAPADGCTPDAAQAPEAVQTPDAAKAPDAAEAPDAAQAPDTTDSPEISANYWPPEFMAAIEALNVKGGSKLKEYSREN